MKRLKVRGRDLAYGDLWPVDGDKYAIVWQTSDDHTQVLLCADKHDPGEWLEIYPTQWYAVVRSDA